MSYWSVGLPQDSSDTPSNMEQQISESSHSSHSELQWRSQPCFLAVVPPGRFKLKCTDLERMQHSLNLVKRELKPIDSHKPYLWLCNCIFMNHAVLTEHREKVSFCLCLSCSYQQITVDRSTVVW